MPIFETPEPITVALDLGAADVRLSATGRRDTDVTVRPGRHANEAALQAVEQVRVEYDSDSGTLRISSPKARAFGFPRKNRTVEITVGLPAGSRLTGEVQTGDVRASGPLGECRLKTSDGDIHLERTGPAHLVTSDGDIAVGSIDGDAEISTGDGDVRIGHVEGTAVIENSDGDTTITTVAGDVRVRADDGDIRLGRAGAAVDARTSDGDVRIDSVSDSARARTGDGDVTIGRAGGDVDAKTSDGEIRLGEVVQGSVVLTSDDGDLEIGIAAGTAAWLDVHTSSGRVRSDLESTSPPGGTERTVQVRARTSDGDITVRRAAVSVGPAR